MTARRDAPSLVLLVEDDALSLKLMKDVLDVHGYKVTQAVNGPDALVMARQQALDLIVMDVGLPGMDGTELTRLLKSDPTLSDIPVLAVSAYAMPGDETRMRDAGCNSFMTKPLRFSAFVHEVGRLLGERDSLTLRNR